MNEYQFISTFFSDSDEDDEVLDCGYGIKKVLCDQKCEVDVCPRLSINDRQAIEELVRFRLNTVSERSLMGPDMKMNIRLTSDVPFYQSPRPLSYHAKKVTDEIVADLLKEGIIKTNDSPYSSPIVLVKKKSGDNRMCVDYRNFNKLTLRDNYPLPRIEDCLDYFRNKKFFSI